MKANSSNSSKSSILKLKDILSIKVTRHKELKMIIYQLKIYLINQMKNKSRARMTYLREGLLIDLIR
jgi:hypothetical protein